MNRSEEEAKLTHAQLLKAFRNAAAANDIHVVSLKEAIGNNDVSRAEVAVQALRASAEAIFTADGGSNFGSMRQGLVHFMEKHSKSLFGKQNRELWQDCCERLYDELLISNKPEIIAKRAKAALDKEAKISRFIEDGLVRYNSALKSLSLSSWRASTTASVREDPIKFLNSCAHQRWYMPKPSTRAPLLVVMTYIHFMP
jgi:hypothetical protein